jgi:hypothetical protein
MNKPLRFKSRRIIMSEPLRSTPICEKFVMLVLKYAINEKLFRNQKSNQVCGVNYFGFLRVRVFRFNLNGFLNKVIIFH